MQKANYRAYQKSVAPRQNLSRITFHRQDLRICGMAGRIGGCQQEKLSIVPPTVLASIAAFSHSHNHVIMLPQSESRFKRFWFPRKSTFEEQGRPKVTSTWLYLMAYMWVTTCLLSQTPVTAVITEVSVM